MSTPVLSSNWKQLQKKLRGEDGSAPSKVIKKKKKVKKVIKKVEPEPVPVEQPKVDLEALVKLEKDGRYDVARLLLEEDMNLTAPVERTTQTDKKSRTGKYLAVDCEFVGVGTNGVRSVLARVSIVNYYGVVVMDKFVKPSERVTDWRTWVSGVRPSDVRDADSFESVQKEVDELFRSKILVGHAIQNDLRSLMISHPKSRIRDTSQHKPFRTLTKGGPPALKRLAEEILRLNIQSGSHSSVEDAQATMLLFRLHKHQFDATVKKNISN